MNELSPSSWDGPEGDAYNARNPFERDVERQRPFLDHILRRPRLCFASVTELGCGSGANLSVIAELFHGVKTRGIELNANSAEAARQRGHEIQCADATLTVLRSDLVLWCGALIHIPPHQLEAAYRITDQSARMWVVMAEYFNPTPVQVPHHLPLWKRDFAGEFMDAYPAWHLLDYGFAYKRDASLGNQDNVNWWLMERRQ